MNAVPAMSALIHELAPHVLGWSLVAARIAGVFLLAPLLSSVIVPMRAKSVICLALACAAYPLLTQGPTLAATDVVGLVPVLLGEALIGFTIGAIASVPIVMMELAGVLSGTTMGMGLARVYDPQQEAEVDLLGQLLFFVAMGIFFAFGGIESLFRGLLASFERVPSGQIQAVFAGSGSALDTFTGVVASGFELGIRISAPVVAIVFLIIILMGVLGKTMPQMNVLSVGFAIKVLMGVLMLAWGLYSVREPISENVREALLAGERWVGSLGGLGGDRVSHIEGMSTRK